MATDDLVDGIMKAISKLPDENAKEVHEMIREISENMDMDKHSLKDIVEFAKFMIISLSFTVYMTTYMKKQEQGY